MLLNPQETADLVTFTEENLNGKLQFLCSVICWIEILILLCEDKNLYLNKESSSVDEGFIMRRQSHGKVL